ncbi:hypothetical protein HDU80_005886 [Chytriomyces hyalinus]|nr:hypothetical protein HDU80_005886 [Chytriomyces hyalinus]
MEFLQPQKAPKVASTSKEKESQKRLIVVLEQASLETVKLGKGKEGHYALLNCDDHHHLLKKNNRDISESRPDITHQCLLTLLDSPLNKAGLLQVYIHTTKNALIEVNPHVRIPRTFKRFCGLMVQLLHKLSIRSVAGPEKLLKIIKNPITDHLPANARKITMSSDSAVVKCSDYVKTLPDGPIVFFIGAMAHGEDNWVDDIVDEKISISEFPLSASVTCGKLTCAFEDMWGVLYVMSRQGPERRGTLASLFVRKQKESENAAVPPTAVRHVKEFSTAPDVPVPVSLALGTKTAAQRSREYAANLTIKKEAEKEKEPIMRRSSSIQLQRTPSTDSSRSGSTSGGQRRQLAVRTSSNGGLVPTPPTAAPASRRISVSARPPSIATSQDYKSPTNAATAPRKPRPSSVAVPIPPAINRKQSVISRISTLPATKPAPLPSRKKSVVRESVTPVESTASESIPRKSSISGSSVMSPTSTEAGEAESPRRKTSIQNQQPAAPEITRQMLESIIAELKNTLAIQRSRLEFTTHELDSKNSIILEMQKSAGFAAFGADGKRLSTCRCDEFSMELEILKAESFKSIGYKNETIDSLRRQLRLKDTSIGNMTAQLAKLKLDLDHSSIAMSQLEQNLTAKTIECDAAKREMIESNNAQFGAVFELKKEIGKLESQNAKSEELTATLKREVAHFQSETARLRAEIDMLQNELGHSVSTLKHKTRQIEELESENSRLVEQVAGQTQLCADTRLQLADANNELEAIFSDMRSREEAHEVEMQQARSEHEAEVKKLRVKSQAVFTKKARNSGSDLRSPEYDDGFIEILNMDADSEESLRERIPQQKAVQRASREFDSAGVDSSITHVYDTDDGDLASPIGKCSCVEFEDVLKRAQFSLDAIQSSAEQMAKSFSFAKFERSDALLCRVHSALHFFIDGENGAVDLYGRDFKRSSAQSIESSDPRRSDLDMRNMSMSMLRLSPSPPGSTSPSPSRNLSRELKLGKNPHSSIDKARLRSFTVTLLDEITNERNKIRFAMQESQMFSLWINSVVSDISEIQEIMAPQ